MPTASSQLTIQFPFMPEVVWIFNNNAIVYNSQNNYVFELLIRNKKYGTGNLYGEYNVINWSDNSISYYQTFSSGADTQGRYLNSNTQWSVFCLGTNKISPFEKIITTSSTYTIPASGKYNLELYGGGGGVDCTAYHQPLTVAGGTCCQRYEELSFTKGQVVDVIIGEGGTSKVLSNQPSATAGQSTSFGNYSVPRGGLTIYSDSQQVVGQGNGNKGIHGIINTTQEVPYPVGSGIYSDLYGLCGGKKSKQMGVQLDIETMVNGRYIFSIQEIKSVNI